MLVGARPPAGMAQGRKARRAHALTTGAAAEGCQPGALHVSGFHLGGLPQRRLELRALRGGLRGGVGRYAASGAQWELYVRLSTFSGGDWRLGHPRNLVHVLVVPSLLLGTASGLGLVVIAVQYWSSARRLALVVCSGWRVVDPGYVDWCAEVDQVACEPVEGY